MRQSFRSSRRHHVEPRPRLRLTALDRLAPADGNLPTPHHRLQCSRQSGMAESTNRTLKAALMARCTGPDWKSQLPWVLLIPRITLKEGLGVSSAEIVYGETTAILARFFRTNIQQATDKQLAELRRTVGKYSPCQKTWTDSSRKHVPKRYRRANTCSSGTMHADHP